jgi:hypothetical protein
MEARSLAFDKLNGNKLPCIEDELKYSGKHYIPGGKKCENIFDSMFPISVKIPLNSFDGELFGFSYLYERIHLLIRDDGMDSYSLIEIMYLRDKLCGFETSEEVYFFGYSLEELTSHLKNQRKKNPLWCIDLIYINKLLIHFGMRERDRIIIAKSFDGIEGSWSLGVGLKHIRRS